MKPIALFCLTLKPDQYGKAPRSLISPGGAPGPGHWHALPFAPGDYLRGVGKIIEALHAEGVEMFCSSSNPGGLVDPLLEMHPTPRSMLAFRAN